MVGRRNEQPPVRVVVVDDHPMIVEWIETILHQAGMQVLGAAYEGGAAVDLIARHRPDVLVLDVRLPDMSGVEVASRVRAAFPAVAVLVLTGYEDPEDQRALLRLGVRAILRKTIPGEDFVAAVQMVAKGATIVHSGDLVAGDSSEMAHLTIRESQVLALLGHARQNAEIARALGVSKKTVELHVHHLLTKLGAHSRTEAVLKAQQLRLLGTPRNHVRA
jgi:DNA-binding NarL/FixJ family response regulator